MKKMAPHSLWTAGLFAAATLVFSLTLARAGATIPPGSASLDAELVLDGLQHTLQNGMTNREDGLNKAYTYNHNSSTRPNTETEIGQILYLTGAIRPHESFYADARISYLGNYADTLWRPINDPHRQEVTDKKLQFLQGEAEFRNNDARLRVFQGKSFEDWRAKGDLFGLLPGQYELERYLNFSGHGVPRGAEGQWQTRLGELGFVAGPEVMWGAGRSVFARYNITRRAVRFAAIYKHAEIPFGEEGEDLRAAETTLSMEPMGGRLGVKTGLLYQPFRLDRPYQRAERTAPGQGTYGSSYIISDDITREHDAWGGTLQLSYYPDYFLDRVDAGYEVRRPVAGNKQEYTAAAYKKMTQYLSTNFQYAFREPIVGPLPFLYQGTPDNPGALLVSPRGEFSPFWVTSNSEGDIADNRKAHMLKWTFTQDSTPETWLFRYDPHILDFYNVNPLEDAQWAYAFQYRVEYFPTGTDHTFYFDKEGRAVWEGPYHSGAWATKAPLHSASFLLHRKVGALRNLFLLQGGESMATGSDAYTTRTDGPKPLTSFLRIQDELHLGPYTVAALVSANDWGPEEFHRRFGETFDRLYQLRAQRDFRTRSTVGISYIRAREEDNRFFQPDLGGFDEWRIFFIQRFGVLARFDKSREAPETPAIAIPPPAVKEEGPHSILVTLDGDTFNPDQSPDPFRIRLIADNYQSTRWYAEIRDRETNSVVKSYAGYAIPREIYWDGKSAERPAPEGDYRVDFGVIKSGEILKSSAPFRLVRTTPQPAQITVEKSEEGLRVSLKSQVLFAAGKAELKPAAKAQLNEVVKLLQSYPNNKVRVVGHTDSIGSDASNLVLSVKRAKGVADYLIKKGGFAPDRFKTVGMGAKVPLASNKTAAGREANRRVEVIILKEEKELKEETEP